jgi:hypothetical protein
MKKHLLLIILLTSISFSGMAQFKYVTNTNIGQKYLIDSIDGQPTGIEHFTVDFNSILGNSYYTATTVVFKKCQTQKGLQVNVYPDSTTTTNIKAGDFKCELFNNNGNPVHVASVDSMIALMKKFTQLNLTTADSTKNLYWKPGACLFDVVKGDTTNLAFGTYPGKYKRVEYGFQFDFTGKNVASDLTFTINTYNAGNTGKTASYDLYAYFGSVSAATAIDTIKNFYVTGSGLKEIKLAEALGIKFSDFSTKKVIFFLKTMGTGTAIEEGKYDPIIVFDDMKVAWGSPRWISPAVAAGTIYNEGGKGTYTEYTLEGTTGTAKLYLKDAGRVGELKIINDVEFPPSLYQFKDSLGVYANDGSGKYTVPVSYKFYPSVLNSETGSYSDSYIAISAPVSGSSTNDDIMVLMTFKPKQSSETIERLEIDNGVRFWWDVQTCSIDNLKPNKIIHNETTSFDVISNNRSIYVYGAKGQTVIYDSLGRTTGVYTSSEAEKGIQVKKGIYMVSTDKGKVKISVQ